MKRTKCEKCGYYDNGVCDKYGIFTEPNEHCDAYDKREQPKLHLFDFVSIITMIILFVLMIFYYTKTIEPIPDTVVVTSRSEKVIRTYSANPVVKDGKLEVLDAILLGEIDVSNYTE